MISAKVNVWLNNYVIMWPIICEGRKVLADRYDNMYTNNPTNPIFIGVREVTGIINKLAKPNIS